MKSFIKKNKFKILAIALSLVIIFTFTSRVFGTEYESLDFSVRQGYSELFKCKMWARA